MQQFLLTARFDFEITFFNSLLTACLIKLIVLFFFCVCCYLKTASGKTYTMGMGTNCGTSDGIIPKVMEDVFTRVEAVKSQIRVSFLEVRRASIFSLFV